MKEPLSVAFVWHMHQPSYFDSAAGVLTLPWVRLHATKDYVDMVELLEEFPTLHQTFNVTPVLLDQLAWYGAGHQDAWQALAMRPTEALTGAKADALARQCTFAHPQRMVASHPRYYELVARLQRGQTLGVQDLRDLTVWFHLVWIDPRWRSRDPQLAGLIEKGAGFSEDEKQAVLAAHEALIRRVIPTYRAAQDRGHIEVATSPYAHPILPLLADSSVAQEATPGLGLPRTPFVYPDDLDEHLRRAVASYTDVFGQPPRGLWPSEGSVSGAILPAVTRAGFRWMATDEAILWRSLDGSAPRTALYQPYRVTTTPDLALVFRDRTLSDLIGFSYAGVPAEAAAADFIQRLHRIHDDASVPAPLVAVILDGENAWEHYPEDGTEFLRRLYDGLSRDSALRCVTVSEYLAQHPPTVDVPRIAAGSWIRGDFTTWIGDPEKNAAWNVLAQARSAYATAVGTPTAAEALPHLLIAEGSDWFWWYGPEHTSAHDAEFDRLFRARIAAVYEALGMSVPLEVRQPIARMATEGPVPPSRWIHPTIDGVVTDYFEWLYAGHLECAHARGAMAPGSDRLKRIWWGCDHEFWYMRLDMDGRPIPERDSMKVVLTSATPPFKLEVTCGSSGIDAVWAQGASGASDAVQWGPTRRTGAFAADQIVELQVPLEQLGLKPGSTIQAQLQIWQHGVAVETLPPTGFLTLTLPGDLHDEREWSA